MQALASVPTVSINCAYSTSTHLTITILLTGPNGIRVLQELDILDEVLSRSDQEKPEVRPFRYLFGVGEHEHIYDVSINILAYTSSYHNRRSNMQ